MKKTLSEVADEIVESMNQEEFKKAAKTAIMLSYRLIEIVLKNLKKEQENGKEE